MILPGPDCITECRGRTRYDPEASSSSVDVGTFNIFGPDGEVRGEVYLDDINLAGLSVRRHVYFLHQNVDRCAGQELYIGRSAILYVRIRIDYIPCRRCSRNGVWWYFATPNYPTHSSPVRAEASDRTNLRLQAGLRRLGTVPWRRQQSTL